jgi:serine/threonine protein kinase
MANSHLALEAVVRHDGHTIARCLLRRGRYVVGHDRKNEIVAAIESVSSKHARLTVSSDEHFFLEDLGSANGTLVDGIAIEALTPLTLDSAVRLGQATLTFERGGLPAAVFRHLPKGFLRATRYAVGRAIVEGRTSTIFEAHDSVLRRTIAMKVLRAEAQADRAQVLTFVREAQIAAQLPHAGILPVYDFGLDPEIGLFSATRFIEGESLADLLTGMASGDSTAPHASLFTLLRIFSTACSTVAYAHTRGVVHGALRPEAIIFGQFGEVFVEHWGFAKINVPPDSGKPLVQAPDLTITPPLSRYTAPEQAEGVGDIDPRTDVHALGAILFRILTLRNFNEGESAEALRDHALRPPFTPTEALAAQQLPAHLPGSQSLERLIAACSRALNHSREERFTSAQDLKKEIGGWLESAVNGGEQTKIWKQLAGLLGRH